MRLSRWKEAGRVNWNVLFVKVDNDIDECHYGKFCRMGTTLEKLGLDASTVRQRSDILEENRTDVAAKMCRQ